MAKVLLDLGRTRDALTTAREATLRFPADVVAGNTLGDVLLKTGRYVEAEAQYREIITQFPNDAFAHCGLADALLKQGRAAEAEAQYRETTVRFPNNVVARSGLADALLKQGRAAEAEVAYREIVAQFPRERVAWGGVGHALIAQKRWDAALEWFKEGARRFPDNEVLRDSLKAARKATGTEADVEMEIPPQPQAKVVPAETAPLGTPVPKPPQGTDTQARGLRPSDIEILVGDAFSSAAGHAWSGRRATARPRARSGRGRTLCSRDSPASARPTRELRRHGGCLRSTRDNSPRA